MTAGVSTGSEKYPFLRWLERELDKIPEEEIERVEKDCPERGPEELEAGAAHPETRALLAWYKKLIDRADELARAANKTGFVSQGSYDEFQKSYHLANLVARMVPGSYYHTYPALWGKPEVKLARGYTVVYKDPPMTTITVNKKGIVHGTP